MIHQNIKVGIITMHRVINVGSLLQAYALQEIVYQLGYEAEIIDYQYPNDEHVMYRPRPNTIESTGVFSKIVYKLTRMKAAITGARMTDYEVRRQKFDEFIASHCHLSSMRYNNRYQLGKNPPTYDTYLTGSDQVWNPNYIGYDTSFMLGFVNNLQAKRIAYAPSVSVSEIPAQFKNDYALYLKKYDALSVRETQSIELVAQLSGCIPIRVCDPTLLLTKNDWYDRILKSDNLPIGTTRYFVIYILNYKFNPYPDVFRIIEQAHKRFGGEIVVLEGETSDYMRKKGAKKLNTLGPKDFLYYIMNARFMVTTSFHGTVFSLNFNIPFVCIMDSSQGDTRITSLLADYGAQKFGIETDAATLPNDLSYEASIVKRIDALREKSLAFLKDSLKSSNPSDKRTGRIPC